MLSERIITIRVFGKQAFPGTGAGKREGQDAKLSHMIELALPAGTIKEAIAAFRAGADAV